MNGKLSFQEVINMVRKFMDTYKLNVLDSPKADIGKETIELRYELMKEENEEYLEAAQKGDMVEVADALGDMLYILAGTMLAHGMQDKMEAVFTEIQRSNMSKLGEDGQPIYREDGKVLKGPNYSKPDIKSVLEG
jgi:predicted HAD superfamily Cof-like phosphohydrolase